jgi:hypothetical protein
MGLLLAFAVGYFTGGRAGGEGLDEVIAALRAIMESEEVESLLVAVRSHAGYALVELGKRLSPEAESPISMQEVLGRIRVMVQPDDVTSDAS